MDAKAEYEAERLLDGVWTKIAGGRRIPVDPVRIASELGIDVFPTELDPEVSGLIIKERNRDPVILLSNKDHPNRQRFTAAHELGHFVLRADNPEEFGYVDLRDPDSATGERPEEIFANAFAACLLMPEKELRAAYKEHEGSDVELAFVFKVSREALVNRLKNLGLPVG